jgi:hypothetical protein
MIEVSAVPAPAKIPEPVPAKYPYIGKHTISSLIVLFHGTNAGIVIVQNTSDRPVGTMYDGWNEHAFNPYDGVVTFKNK